ncbi:AAA family ATPase [Tumebacillus algifaecis]|uniref:AAA family ATPase n=1 Tax=Tumebacillus algifaecis TaxID=1214604 RepID=UPI0012FE3383|nr:AAA family ATPase [Tumebacillus algifaecis]
MKPFLVIEGVDGTGKSTVCAALEQEQGAAFYKGMSPEWRDFRDFVDEDADDDSRLLYYFASCMYTSGKVKKSGEKVPVICHRYFATYMAIYSLNTGTPLEKVLEAFAPIRERMVTPHLSILLTADHEELKRRLLARVDELKATDMRVVNSHEYTLNFEAALRAVMSWDGPYIVLDTTGKTPEQVVSEVRQLCVQHIPGWPTVIESSN